MGVNINIYWAKVIVEELARSGVRDVVISPGSRSTPLVLAFAAHPDIEDISVIDERSAAFHAIGIAKASGRPTAMLCTSGTAAANYLPAVSEADASHIPLIVCTADRPAELRHSGAPQTMVQSGIYGERVRYMHDLPQAEADVAKLRALRAIVCHSVTRALAPLPGPVHLNIPFRKPLEPLPPVRIADTIPPDWSDSTNEAIIGRIDGRAWLSTLRWSDAGTHHHLRFRLIDLLLRAKRPLILAGPHHYESGLREIFLAFAAQQGIPVLAEAASNIRYGPPSPVIFGTSDHILRSAEFRSRLQPDLLLQFGGAATNQALQRFIDELEDVPFIVVTATDDRVDPSHRAVLHVVAPLSALITDISDTLSAYLPAKRDKDWLPMFQTADTAAVETLDNECDNIEEFFEGKVLASLRTLLPPHNAVFLSSSMPIRDAETFLTSYSKKMAVYVNRGVNGIDGIISTALGIARERKCVLVTGDIAVLHNLNALAGEGLNGLQLTILLLNNAGGQIFDMLPVRDFEPPFTKHFVTPHTTDFSAVFAAFGVKHSLAQSWNNFNQCFTEALSYNGVAVVEIRTDISASSRLRRELLKRIASAVDAVLLNQPRMKKSNTITFPLSWTDYPGKADPVVLLHGFSRGAASWKMIRNALGDHRVITIELPGHGVSPTPDYEKYPQVWTPNAAAVGMEDILQTLGIARAHIVGYSLGARIALHHALRFPKRVLSLSLLSGNAGIEDPALRNKRVQDDEKLIQKLLQNGLAHFINYWCNLPLFSELRFTHPQEWREARFERRLNNARGLAASLRGSGQGAQESLWGRLKELSCPVLAVAGTRDSLYAAIAKRLAAQSDGEYVLLEQCGHDIILGQPEALAKTLNSFWMNIEAF